MPEKKKPSVKPLPPKKLSDKEAANVKGGMVTRGGIGGIGGILRESEQCKETTDTGITGCPG